jgi:hypothetical protein
MGDFLTHVVQAERVLERIESRRVVDGIRSNMKLFRLGAQGPDPLFFHHCFPGDGKGSLVAVGTQLHLLRTGTFLVHGFRQLSPVSWNAGWIQLASYLTGFVCHFCADRFLHPYVNAMEHNWAWSRDGLPARTTHGEMETMLDVILWREEGHGPAARARTAGMCPGPQPWPEPIVNFWVTGLYDVFRLHVRESLLAETARDFHRAHALLYDPRGIKKQLVQWIDGLTGGAFHPAKMPYPLKETMEIDWMNIRHRTWSQPELPDVRRNETVEELMAAAVNEAANSINGLFAVLFRQEGHLEQWLPNLDYNTNLPCLAPL